MIVGDISSIIYLVSKAIAFLEVTLIIQILPSAGTDYSCPKELLLASWDLSALRSRLPIKRGDGNSDSVFPIHRWESHFPDFLYIELRRVMICECALGS